VTGRVIWGQSGLIRSEAAKISEEGDWRVIGPVVIWRLAPGESAIRSENPGNRNWGA